MDDSAELAEAARRGLQRASTHLMKAAIELVAGLSAFLEEINAAARGEEDDGEGRQRIEVE